MYIVFFFNDTATTEIYTLSLHDALPIFLDDEVDGDPRVALEEGGQHGNDEAAADGVGHGEADGADRLVGRRSEEQTSELQSRQYLVCRLLLEKKKYWLIHESVHILVLIY